jgi:hypothetical protein
MPIVMKNGRALKLMHISIQLDIFMILQDSAVGITTCYGLDDQRIGVRVPVGSRIFSFHVIQTGSGVHPTSYPVGTGGKAAGA